MKGSCRIMGLALATVVGWNWGASAVQAQSSGWAAYSPTVAWAAPATVAPPADVPAQAASGWAGYGQTSPWRTYQPQASWAGYAPQGGWTTGPTVTDRPRRGMPISSRNREYGTGRNVAMIKPWLPPSPG